MLLGIDNKHHLRVICQGMVYQMAFSDVSEYKGWNGALKKLMDDLYSREALDQKKQLHDQLEPLLRTQQLMAFQHYVHTLVIYFDDTEQNCRAT